VAVIRVRGVALPGDIEVDYYIDGGRLRLDPVAGAETVVHGGWLVPGLVDVHSHPGAATPAGPLVDDTLRADAQAEVDVGVTLLRSPGLAGPVPQWFREDPAMPSLVSAGAWLASADRFSDHEGRKVAETALAAAAVAEATANDGWCKIVGDSDYRADPLPAPMMRAIVDAVHAAGGRVAVHCQTAAGCRAAVEASVDSLEHGMNLEPDLIGPMAAHGTAWVPTLSAFAGQIEFVRARPAGPRRDWYVGGYDRARGLIRDAHDAGVLVLAGTDTGPQVRVPDEIRLLAASGLPIEVAIGAGSWLAREFLGAPADLVAYDEDPRRNPDVLDHPSRVIVRGTVVR
jgi:imidazolonepropionase-like amidohydrolase